MLHAGDGITDGIRAEQEAARKRQEAENNRLREFREKALQRRAQIAKELVDVAQERVARHEEEQRNRTRCYDDFGDEPYCEGAMIDSELWQAGYQARKLGIQNALMATGLFYSDEEDRGLAKGQPLPDGVRLGFDVTSARGQSPIVTKQEYDRGMEALEHSRSEWPSGVYADNAMDALGNHGVVVSTGSVRCADSACVDLYGRRICQGHNFAGTRRTLSVDRADGIQSEAFVKQLIAWSHGEMSFMGNVTNARRERSASRGKVDREGNFVGHQ